MGSGDCLKLYPSFLCSSRLHLCTQFRFVCLAGFGYVLSMSVSTRCRLALQELSRKDRCQTHQRIHLQISFSALVGSSVCSIFHYPWVLCCQTKEKWSTHWSVPSFHVLDEGKRTLQADFPPRTFKSNIRIQVIVLLVLLVLGDVSCFERKLT